MKPGDFVRVTENLDKSKTQINHGIDGSGYMLKMQGNVFPIHRVTALGCIYIHNFETDQNFVFSPDDVTIVSEEEAKVEMPEQIFSFNEQNLLI